MIIGVINKWTNNTQPEPPDVSLYTLINLNGPQAQQSTWAHEFMIGIFYSSPGSSDSSISKQRCSKKSCSHYCTRTGPSMLAALHCIEMSVIWQSYSKENLKKKKSVPGWDGGKIVRRTAAAFIPPTAPMAKYSCPFCRAFSICWGHLGVRDQVVKTLLDALPYFI